MRPSGSKIGAVTSILLTVPLGAAVGQTFSVKDYGATGSSNTATCSGQAGSNLLTGCQAPVHDFQKGQVIHIVGGGPSPASRAFLNNAPLPPKQYADPPLIIATPTHPKATDYPNGDAAPGTSFHSYCYSVSIADPLQGISAPSPVVCQPNDAPNHTFLYASAPANEFWFKPIFLWYISKDGENYQLLGATQGSNSRTDRTYSFIDDFGQAFAPRPLILAGAQSTLATRGGWPNDVSNPDVRKNEDLFATIYSIDFTSNGINVELRGIEADPQGSPVPLDSLPPVTLGSTFQNATIKHDDTQAVQHAINAADNAGGGAVAFDAGTYNIQRPFFIAKGTPYNALKNNPYLTLTTDLNNSRDNYTPFSFLSISNGATGHNGKTGHVHLNGLDGSTLSTVLQTPPDQAGLASVFAIAAGARADAIPNSVISIYPVMKGSSTVRLLSGQADPGLQPGDDVLLFSGTFGTTNLNTGAAPSPCKIVPFDAQDLPGSAGECHYTELNTIASISAPGNYVLQYPASKMYYTDNLGSDYGMVKAPPRPHDIELYHMAINTYDHVTGAGDVYDFTVDAVQINGYVGGGTLGGGGAFGGGYKRNVVLKNSAWGLGDGEAGASAEEEYDKFTNLQILNNHIVGDAPMSSFGPSSQARLFATEGTSNVTYYSNSFDNVSLFFDQSTDVTINNNHFHQSNINIGDMFGRDIGGGQDVSGGMHGGFDSDRTWSYASFGSQTSAAVTSNQFTIDSGYSLPWVIRLGHFDTAAITGNVINYNSAFSPAMILTASGTVTGNTINAPPASSVVAILAQPDKANQGPDTTASTIRVTGNTVKASSISSVVLATPASIQPPNPPAPSPPNPTPTVANPASLPICASGNNPSGLITTWGPTPKNPIPVTVQACQ